MKTAKLEARKQFSAEVARRDLARARHRQIKKLQAAFAYESDLVEIICPDCRKTRRVQRTSVARGLRRNGRVHNDVCHACANRRNKPGTVPPVIDSTSHHRYWLDRYTLEEIRELAAGLEDLSPTALQAEPTAPLPKESAIGSDTRSIA